MTWEKILIRILDGEKNIPSPFAKNGVLESLFVIVDKVDRMGYLLIWCTLTHKAVKFSRIQVPDQVDLNITTSASLRESPPIELVLQDIDNFTTEMENNMAR